MSLILEVGFGRTELQLKSAMNLAVEVLDL